MKDDLQVASIIMNHINRGVEIILKGLSENGKVLNNIEKELTQLKTEKSGEWVGITDNLQSEKHFRSLCDIKAISKLSLCENDNGTLEYKAVELLTDYCPNCGAKMKKED